MQFAVVALFVALGCVMADDPTSEARKMMANRILTADPSTFISCEDDSGCAAKPSWKCNPLMKMCSPGNAPDMPRTEGSCQSTGDCRPLYRCSTTNQCSFVGPRACSSEADCEDGVDGTAYDCKELPKNAPGKRCWLKCANDNECHSCKADGSECRVPENFRKHIGCCQGTCQRKAACV